MEYPSAPDCSFVGFIDVGEHLVVEKDAPAHADFGCKECLQWCFQMLDILSASK